MPGETIYLVRHGQTRWNEEGRIQGHRDSELTDLGVEQAHAYGRLLARHLPHESDGPFAIESSPIGRALATARVIADELGADPENIGLTALLAERDMGRWAGLTLGEVEQSFPGVDPRTVIDDPDFSPPDGETYTTLLSRAGAWLERRRSAPTTIAVTHGLIGRTIIGAYLRQSALEVMAGSRPQDRVFRLHDGTVEELAV